MNASARRSNSKPKPLFVFHHAPDLLCNSRFIQNLGCHDTHIYMYVCVVAMHVPYIRLYRLVSLRREFVTDSRLFDVLLRTLFFLPLSPGCYSILLSSSSLCHLNRIYLALSCDTATRGCIRKSPVHVYPLHAVVRIPAGPIHPWGTLLTHSRAWRDTHTRI